MPKIDVVIKRRDSREQKTYEQRFAFECQADTTVAALLRLIQADPVTAQGEKTTPVAWECNCLEEVCGACAMRVNGVPMLACSAFVLKQAKDNRIVVEPLAAFPVIRDLVVDRSDMRAQLRRYRIGQVKRSGKEKVAVLYPYSRCIQCGCCIDACPNVGGRAGFHGAYIIGRIRFSGTDRELRKTLAQRGGIANCSGFGLCGKYCPKKIDLASAMGKVNRKMITHRDL